jgi:hypothetical protein
MGFHLEIHGDTAAFVKQLRANPASVFGRPYGGYLLFLFEDYGPGRKVHEWIQKRARALDAITGGSIAFALFSRTLRAEVSGGGATGSSQAERRAEFDPADFGLDGEGFDVNRLVKSGLFGRIEDRVTIEAVNVAVVDVARQFDVLDKLPCVIVMDGLPIAGGNAKPFDVIELSGQEMEGFDKALQVATAQFERHPNHSVYVEKIRSLHAGALQLEDLDEQLKLTTSKEEQAKRVLLDALKEVARVAEPRTPVFK